MKLKKITGMLTVTSAIMAFTLVGYGNADTEVETSAIEEDINDVESIVRLGATETDLGIETVNFGQYSNSNEDDLSDISWKVLTSDDEKVLLLSENIIDAIPYNDDRTSIGWEDSSIRDWLNNDFGPNTFSELEWSAILTDEENSDKIFLLTAEEAMEYLPLAEERVAAPTEYAIDKGVYTNETGNAAWWLKSKTKDDGAVIDYFSSAGDLGTRTHYSDENIIGVRPAVWVDIDYIIENQVESLGYVEVDKDAPDYEEAPLINASEIWADYDKNPAKYDATYDGEYIEATGYINFIGTDSHGTPSMEITDKYGDTSYVLGVFGSFDEMSSVKEGDLVTISGYFHIMSAENMVVLKRTNIEQIYE